jgi:hypothetical protein
MLSGELKVAAYADLGGLGSRQGPQVPFSWRLPNLLPVLLPWLAVLALLALPSNRSLRAWWIWAPLGVVALIGAALQLPITTIDDEGFNYAVQAACSAAFGLAVAWLLGGMLASRGRFLAIALVTLAFAATSLLAFVLGPAGEQLSDISRWEPAVLLYLVLFWVVSGIVYTGALHLTGWWCRRRFNLVRVALWLPAWLWAMWLLAACVLGLVVTLTSGGGFEWLGFVVASFILALVSFAVVAPYLILSFTNSLYRERSRHLLRLPAEAPVTPVPEAPPVLEQAVRQ